jgi:glycosyltransferase involved in cell wall biosynthesis
METISMRLTAGLSRRGFEVSVLTGRDDPRLPRNDEWEGIPIHRLDLNAALKSRDAVRLAALRHDAAELARELAPDLVHVPFAPQAAFLALGARLDRLAPMLVTFHGWWPVFEEAGPTMARRVIQTADWVTACSDATLESVRAFEPSIASRSSLTPNGLDSSAPPVEPPEDGSPLVVGLGRLSPEKGFDVLLQAFAQLRGRAPDARLELAGRGMAEGSLLALARELGIADSVDFSGWVDAAHIPALLDRATVVAVPSRLEGFGMTALEAALRARPVVATRVGGLPEVVEDGVTGMLVAVDSPGELATAIGALLGDRKRGMRLGQAGRERAQRLFPEDRLLREHADLYGRLVADASRASALEAPI